MECDLPTMTFWRMEPKRDVTTIVVQPFEILSAEIVTGLEAEVRDIRRFLKQNAQLWIKV
jgi:hypothetical protein